MRRLQLGQVTWNTQSGLWKKISGEECDGIPRINAGGRTRNTIDMEGLMDKIILSEEAKTE